MKTIYKFILLALAIAGTLHAAQPIETLTAPQKATMRSSLGLGTAATADMDNSTINAAIATNEIATKSTLGDYRANVRDYGAVGDGTTDDTAAINAASLALRLTGGTLYFPRGTYRVRQTTDAEIPWGASALVSPPQNGPRPCFQVFSNMHILGDGPGISIIKHADTPVAGPIINITEANNTRFEGFTLDGNKSQNPDVWAGGDFEGIDTKDDCTNLSFSRIHFKNMVNEGLDLDNDTYQIEAFTVIMRDCLFENIGGEAIHNASWSIIENCQFISCGLGRMAALYHNNPGAQGNGAIDGSGYNTVIRNCYFKNNSSAFDGYSSTGTPGHATGNFLFTGLPVTGQTITVGSRVYTWAGAAKAVTAVASTDVFTSNAHGFTDTTPVRFVVIEIPSGVSKHVTYFVRDSTTNTFKLAATSGGAAIDITTNIVDSGTGFGAYISSDWPTSEEVPIGPTTGITARFLTYAINGLFEVATPKHATVGATVIDASTLAGGASSTVMLKANVVGSTGNSILTSDTSTNVVTSAATLTGGGAMLRTMLRIENCIIEDSQIAGIVAVNVQNSVITGNRIVGNCLAISITSDSVVTENEIINRSYQSTSFPIRSLGLRGIISRNKITNGGIEIFGSDSTVSENVITTSGVGVFVNGVSVNQTRIIGNDISLEGADVNGSTTLIGPAISCGSSQVGASIIGNTVTSSNATANNGIVVGANSSVVGNFVNNFEFYAIHNGGSNNAITGNTYTNCPNGINLTVGVNTITGNIGSVTPIQTQRNGTPEGALTAIIGSTCVDTATGAVYRKTSGTGNTGWVTP